MEMGGFSGCPGPSAPKISNPFVSLARSPPVTFPPESSSVQQQYQRPDVSSPRWGNQRQSLVNGPNSQAWQVPDTFASYLATQNTGALSSASPGSYQHPKRIRSPPIRSTNEDLSRNSSQVISGRLTVSPPRWGNQPESHVNGSQTRQVQSAGAPYAAMQHAPYAAMQHAPYAAMQHAGTSIPARPDSSQHPRRTKSPSLSPTNEDLSINYSQDVPGKSSVSLPRWGNRPEPFASGSQTHFVPSKSTHVATQKASSGISARLDRNQQQKRTRSLTVSQANEDLSRNSSQGVTGRAAVSHPRSGKANQTNWRSSPPAHKVSVEADGVKSTTFHVPKRTRSPPVPLTSENIPGDSSSTQFNTDRELQAKAKRLARFSVELRQPVPNEDDLKKHKTSGNQHDQSLVDRRNFVPDHSLEAAGDFSNGSVLPDSEGLFSSNAIVGLCPDMCPDSEREERERKGDLDKYERLDGDRNQTTQFLAVKKYTRTAEREANLIRPISVLQKTVDYLLALLGQPYDSRFLGMYNFLWDRMRAIRMDLRMQHIFNRSAITMLEQMIRLHIIAMHELCEYTKGEGFSEGFDAHLNIEQMNKTSVELFQMYDDHRKKGIDVPTEKEFRGYYALLKLDKHPGYKVEPAELSLDLAKMTPEIRQAPEVLIAREVARACRTGNFIAFFRLARKATYLQACLMHAHFSKLRTQALASLHSGLQNNQGIPISHVRKWLGMEEEDIESLLEYHGFSVKEFEESYMFKEGPFLNSDCDYATKCSKLVLRKRSSRILDDVVSSNYVVKLPVKEPKQVFPKKMDKIEQEDVQLVEMKDSVDVIDEYMADYEAFNTPRDGPAVLPALKSSADQHLGDVFLKPLDIPGVLYPETPPSVIGRISSPPSGACLTDFTNRNMPSGMKEMRMVTRDNAPVSNAFWTDDLTSSVNETPLQALPGDTLQVEKYQGSLFNTLLEDSATQEEVIQQQENKESMIYPEELEDEKALAIQQEAETLQAKLKLILRIWKRRASKQRELREQRKLAADAALNLLSLGPPLLVRKTESNIVGELNIDHIVKERHEIQRRLWSRLNVAEVVEGVLRERNPNAKCCCWKLLASFQTDDTGRNVSVQRSQTNHFSGQWLRNKLMGAGKEVDDELLVSLPGVSIWKKWSTRLPGSLPTCCLSVIRDTEVDKSDNTAAGASSVLFLVSESIPLELQKVKLHNLIMSLPCGSRLPLLILSGMLKEEVHDPSFMVVNGLGLNDMDETRIKSFSIKFLTEDQSVEHVEGFFSDDDLREGLQWLAEHSPSQPELLRLKTRELVLTQLNASLDVLDKMDVSDVSPNHCISVFNEALDRSVEEVACAADMNPTCWPCPEIDMLEESSDEQKAVNWFLPSIGWSSATKVEPIKSAISGCKLPLFVDNLSWLNRDLHTGKEVHNQKIDLEKYLTRYLTQSSKMMEWTLAARESNVMVQKGAQLVLHDSCYHIVPKWVVIFRRVFNWQLMKLSCGISSVTYVLEHQHESSLKEQCMVTSQVEAPLEIVDYLRYQEDTLPPCFLSQLSLDEMVEVGCNSLPSWREQSQSDPDPRVSTMEHGGNIAMEASTAFGSAEYALIPQQDGRFPEPGSTCTSSTSNYCNGEVVVFDKQRKQDDRLTKLLEQCNIVQNMIDEKLSIYF